MSSTDRWARVEELYERALALGPDDRVPFLDGACGGDAGLRAELQAMLAAEHALDIERLVRDEAPPADPLVGAELGHWRVLGLLGRGGMGTVYRAERSDGQYLQQAALKLVSQAAWGRETEERFRTERQVLARLAHPNIARLLDGGFAPDGRPFLVMELVEGETITEHCAARRLSLDARLRLFQLVCDAVQHAHRALVVHRDIKPANTLVSTAGEVKLLDFGIAKLLDPAAFGLDSAPTRDAGTLLTPEYAAPEQLLGGAITTATDVYSLGVLLYELVTGARPLDLSGKSPIEIERAIEAGPPPPSRRLGRRPDDLDAIVMNALRAAPERRYVSAGQLGEEIGRFLDGQPVIARPDTITYRARRFVGRNRAAVAAALLFTLSLVGFGAVTAWQARRAAAERDAARLERDKAERVVGLLVDLFETSNPSVRPDGDRMTVRELLADAEPRVLDRLDGQPEVRARLRQVFGRIYAARDQYPEARKALEQALAEQRRLNGPDDPDALDSLQQLGLLLTQTQDKDATPVLEEALARTRRVYGAAHERTARALAALAMVAPIAQGKPLLEEALAIRRRLLPADHIDIVQNLGQLAVIALSSNEWERARALYVEALGLLATPESRRHPYALELMNDYAVVLARLNRGDEAERVQREALALAVDVLGPDSYQVANQTNNLAVLLTSSGRLAEAEALFREAYKRHVALFGESNPATTNVTRNVGSILAMQERYDEALVWLDRTLDGLDPTAEYNVRNLHSRQTNRARVLHRLGRSDEALRLLDAAVAALVPRIAVYGPEPLMKAHFARAIVLIETGRVAEGEHAARAAVALFEPGAASTNPEAAGAECLVGWAVVAAADGREAEGRAQLRRCLPLFRAWGQADRRVVRAMEAAAGEGGEVAAPLVPPSR